MKTRLLHYLSLLLSLLFVFSFFSNLAFCKEQANSFIVSSHIITNPDGSWYETIITQSEPIDTRNSVTGCTTKSYYSSENELVWRVKLYGTFTYNGSNSSCTNAYTTINLYKSGWSVISENTSHSGNTASTAVILGLKVLGVTLPAANVNLTLSCDKDGNLS